MFSWFGIKNHKEGISDRDVDSRLHLEGSWEAALARADADAKISLIAQAEGVVIPSEALQRGVDEHRDRLGLHSKEATRKWIKAARLQLSHLVNFVRGRLEYEVLLAGTPSSEIRRWFEEHRNDYEAALLSAISFTNESDAWLARKAAEASLETFHELAWSRPQADPRLPLGGALGWRLRRQLPATVASRALDHGEDLVGPILGGSIFYVYRVWERRPAALTPAIEAQCRSDYLADKIKSLSPS